MSSENNGTAESALKDHLALPEGVVLLKKARGPDGVHRFVGATQTGHVYCVAVEHLPSVCACGEFDAVFSGDRAAVEAASKPPAATDTAAV